MIIKLEDAHKFNDKVTQDELDGLEASIREITGNHFQFRAIRYHGLEFKDNQIIAKETRLIGIKAGDTIQVSDSIINNGLYVVLTVAGPTITLESEVYEVYEADAYITLVKYPADIKAGVVKLLQYDKEMTGKTGVKSRTISRMSESYFDTSESNGGYPKHLMQFIDKYKSLRWS